MVQPQNLWASVRSGLVDVSSCIGIGLACGAAAGGACALFALALAAVSDWRDTHHHIVYLLPFLGFATLGWLQYAGAQVLGGTPSVLKAVSDADPQVSWRMAPMVCIGTLTTHLGGGSAGREGAAVQIGASIAGSLSQLLNLGRKSRRRFLQAGMAAGFAAVFGTPIAGAIFALECQAKRQICTQDLLAAGVSSSAAYLCATQLGVKHGGFVHPETLILTPRLFLSWCALALVVALVASGFIWLTDSIKHAAQQGFQNRAARAFVGGMLVVALWRVSGTDVYLGLGDNFLRQAFVEQSIPAYAFATKGLFTAITIGFGFLGGEVTPLFYIGACLGNAMSAPLQVPVAMAAACGLSAMLAAAAHVPLSLSIMAAETFGSQVFIHAFLVCTIASALRAGMPGIYKAPTG